MRHCSALLLAACLNVSVGVLCVAAGDFTMPGSRLRAGKITDTIASGTKTLSTATVPLGQCAAEQTAPGNGIRTTDTVTASFNGDVTSITGYTAATTGTLRIDVYPKVNAIGIRVCNNTAADITPGSAITLNWRVMR